MAAPTETNWRATEPAPAENVATPLTPPTPGTPGGLPDDRTPLEEPKGPIDPKSAEAAGQVMQSYGALIEQKRIPRRRSCGAMPPRPRPSPTGSSRASELHLQVGKPGDMEGAAGSIYMTVPVVLYGRLSSGGQFSRSGTATLRRVNDVPGLDRGAAAVAYRADRIRRPPADAP